ncbi:uncharacterized protein LOC128868500 isoform X1 [Anastrepha ludens]|uniref:uncharacterized protein LOC128868500 isoform X1 n=1 Tax=Anastrepha ludens TaxID=28586 RepID=UPI0023AFE46F|nr:uncharacterized protein LOC128868500 isoform X1 [Anastrepha ludens]
MMLKFVLLAYLLHLANAAPQLLTFRDGKFGVNFGGYHAEAGLGGLLTGDAAHGGLSASAGTPFGQRASAGLGGSVNGDAAGVLYANAEANPQTGAEAILGGDTSKGGYSGSHAYAAGKSVASTKNHILPGAFNAQVDSVTSGPSNVVQTRTSAEANYDGIQKIRPPKKYLIKPSALSSGTNKYRNDFDHKTTATHHTNTEGVLNRANGISTVESAAKNTNINQNGDSNDDGTDAAASTTVEQRKYAAKTISTHVTDVPHPAAASTATIAIATTKNADLNSSQQRNDRVPQPVVKAHAEGVADIAAAPPTVVVSRQRLRQKSRIRPQALHKRERQQQRQRERERLVQIQRVYWKENAGNEEGALPTRTKVSDVAVQQHTQYAAQASANANANANTNANVYSGDNVAHSKHLTKRVENHHFDYSAPSPMPDLNLNIGPSVVTSALNIPIGILRSLQESLGGLGAAKQGSAVKYH